jgi:tRNA A37 methylthiotransferase MiaB
MLIVTPFHSTINPPVGMAYLRAYLQKHDISCDTLDLNIASRDILSEQPSFAPFVKKLFSPSRRMYIAEVLIWSWHFAGGLREVVDRILTLPPSPVRTFWIEKGVAKLHDTPIWGQISECLRSFLVQRLSNAVSMASSDWVGFTTTITNIASTLYCAKMLRDAFPELFIVLGGPEISERNVHEIMNSCPALDAVVAAPAYYPLVEILKYHRNRMQSIKPIPGVLTREDVRRGAPLVPVTHFDIADVPFADWHGFDLSCYEPGFIVRDRPITANRIPVVPIHTTHGCSYNKCSFCYNTGIYSSYSEQTPDRVVNEIRYQMEKTGSTHFFFTNFELNARVDSLFELCRLISQAGLDMRFYAWLRLDKINEPLLDALFEAGARQIFIGVEAVDDNLLQLMNKGYKSKTALDILELLYGFWENHPAIHYEFNLISDYPGETLASVKNTLTVVAERFHLFYRRVGAVVEHMLHEGTPVFRLIGDQAEGCIGPLLPPRYSIRSYQYLHHEHGENKNERAEIWSAIRSLVQRDGVLLHEIQK